MYWKFQRVKQATSYNFDNYLRKFFEFGVTGLVRENIQNSLDAKLPESEEPVKVFIKLDKISSDLLPGFDDIRERILSLKGHNKYTNKNIATMKKNLSATDCSVISFEDINTKGLSGASSIDNHDMGVNPYKAYAYGKGVHVDDVDSETEKGRGGSHGIGKIASNAASIFHMMYFSNNDENGYKTLGGTIELIDHTVSNNNYLGKGYFTDIKNETYYPYENNNFHPIFNKSTRGLKIVIPFLKSEYDNEKEIIIAVIDSFLFALLEGKLVVEVNEKEISKDNLENYVSDKKYYPSFEDLQDQFTPLYLYTYKKHYYGELKIYDKHRPYLFDLYFLYHEDVKQGRTGIFRRIGMKIEDKKISSNVRAPYNAVLISKTTKEDESLKSLENEAHNKLEYTHITDDDEKANAKYFINQLDKEVKSIIDKVFENQIPAQGKLNTDDILYYNEEDRFKSLLKNRLSEINTTKKSNNRTILKVKKTEEPGNVQRDHSNGKGEHNESKAVKVKLGDEFKKEYFQLKGGIVKRIVTNDKELINIDLKNARILEGNKKKVNLFVRLVDGMGKEYNEEYNLLKQYRLIEDLNSKRKLSFEENVIKDVDVSEKNIKLSLKNVNNSNKYVKLRFYLEV